MKEELVQEFKGKKIAVVGLGISNLALAEVLQKAGAVLTGLDQKPAHKFGSTLAEWERLGIELVLGPEYLADLADYDIVMVSPGVPRTYPQLEKIAKQGKLSSEIDLVFRFSPGPLYGITGSSGKTTTTSLVGEMLQASGIAVEVGGNIGNPVITQLENLAENDNVLLELSSFQLEDLKASPQGALVTNISENHLDWHLTMDNYIRAKKNIYLYQKSADFLVLNYDDPLGAEMAGEANSQVYFFSLEKPVPQGTYAAGDKLIYRAQGQELVFARRHELSLPGEHNVANFLAAALFASLIGADWEVIRKVGQSFTGVEHRLELVGEIAGVRYYNDSIATTPQRTKAALHSFAEPIILIAGGSDKNLSFTELGKEIHTHVKKLIVMGATASKIRAAVLDHGDFPILEAENLENALLCAAEQASAGDVVLLSPACASFDQYPNFAARGAHFRHLVQNLT